MSRAAKAVVWLMKGTESLVTEWGPTPRLLVLRNRTVYLEVVSREEGCVLG